MVTKAAEIVIVVDKEPLASKRKRQGVTRLNFKPDFPRKSCRSYTATKYDGIELLGTAMVSSKTVKDHLDGMFHNCSKIITIKMWVRLLSLISPSL